MSEYIVQSSSLKAVADKIREKTGDSAPLEFPDEFITAIDGLIDPSNPPATPTDSVLFYSASPFAILKNNPSGTALECSTDNINWESYVSATTISAGKLGGWYRLYFRGRNNTTVSTAATQCFQISGIGVKCVGNLNNLINYSGNVTTIANSALKGLFHSQQAIDFDVTLPAVSVGNNAYEQMFYGCKSMTKAPELPATTLGNNCYHEMFWSCISLKTPPPVLPALALVVSCYESMFAGCYRLISPPPIMATSLASACCKTMFQNCNNLEKLPKLYSTTLVTNCYTTMFYDCPKIKLSETQTDEYQTPYIIPYTGTGTGSGTNNMFLNTGGTFTGTPAINTTYYTSNELVPAT